MKWVLAIIPLVLIGIIGVQESFSDSFDEEDKYKAPLRQIRDDGVPPHNVQCNGERILFFKIKTGTPLCIFERSIDRFDNAQIGWYGKGSPYFIQFSDREYLEEQNSNLERTAFVNYKIDSQNNNILYSLSEKITKQGESFLIYNSVFDDYPIVPELREVTIVDTQGNDPVDWNDPRTSVINTSVILDYGLLHRISCDGDSPIGGFNLYKESSFRIQNDVESIHIQHPDRIQNNYSESDTTFKDFFWSQGNAEFAFDTGLKEIAILEYLCTSSLGSTHLYEITFEKAN